MKNLIAILMLAPFTTSVAQVKTVSLDSALNIAYSNNKNLQSVSMQADYYQWQKKTSSEISKTDISLTYGQYNAYYKKDNNFTISQTIPFPSVFGAKSTLADAQIKGAELETAATKNELAYQVKEVFYQAIFWNEYRELLKQQDSMYAQFARSALIRYETGDATLLEKTSAGSRLSGIRNKMQQVESRLEVLHLQLQSLMGVSYPVTVEKVDSPVRSFEFLNDTASVNTNPTLVFVKQQIEIAEKEKNLVAKTGLPEFRLGYFNQSLYGVPLDETNTQFATGGNRFQGVLVGIVVPLWFAPLSNKNKMAQTQVEINRIAFEGEKMILQNRYGQAVQQYLSAKTNLAYFRDIALPDAGLIEKQSQTAYAKGEIGFADYLLGLQQVIEVRENYMAAISEYNQSVIYLEYLVGE